MKIFCIGRNYVDHAKELGNKVPERPLVFLKPASALLLDGKPFSYPKFSKNVHYELEVVLQIGKTGKNIEVANAGEYINGLALGIDFTARDLQAELKAKGHPWEIAKAFDNSAALGKIKPYSWKNEDILFFLHLNDQEVQRGNTADLIFPFDTLISYISRYFTLETGDLIYTGTPAGVGPVQEGDELKGYLKNELVLECNVQ